jgi:hypothetical protein
LKDNLAKIYTLACAKTIAQVQYASAAPSANTAKSIQISVVPNADQVLPLAQQVCPVATKIAAQLGFPIVLNYAAAAGKVDNLPYDEVTTDLSQLPLPQPVQAGLAQQWGGKAAIKQQICKLGEDRLALATGQDSIAEVVKLGKTKPAGLDKNPGIVKTAAFLPPKANGIGFVNIGNFVQTMAAQMPSEQAAGNPFLPLMMSVGSMIKGTVGGAALMTEGRLELDLFVPTELIQSAFLAFTQMQMQMMQPPTEPQQGPAPAQPGQGPTF